MRALQNSFSATRAAAPLEELTQTNRPHTLASSQIIMSRQLFRAATSSHFMSALHEIEVVVVLEDLLGIQSILVLPVVDVHGRIEEEDHLENSWSNGAFAASGKFRKVACCCCCCYYRSIRADRLCASYMSCACSCPVLGAPRPRSREEILVHLGCLQLLRSSYFTLQYLLILKDLLLCKVHMTKSSASAFDKWVICT